MSEAMIRFETRFFKKLKKNNGHLFANLAAFKIQVRFASQSKLGNHSPEGLITTSKWRWSFFLLYYYSKYKYWRGHLYPKTSWNRFGLAQRTMKNIICNLWTRKGKDVRKVRCLRSVVLAILLFLQGLSSLVRHDWNRGSVGKGETVWGQVGCCKGKHRCYNFIQSIIKKH